MHLFSIAELISAILYKIAGHNEVCVIMRVWCILCVHFNTETWRKSLKLQRSIRQLDIYILSQKLSQVRCVVKGQLRMNGKCLGSV